ncbi:MAG: phage tail tape measure protein [Sulfuricurvum sp.]|nr:phage tail tape measure protein [Sulfuricurvum sp.]
MSNKLEIVINTSANVDGIKKASSTLNDLEHATVGASKTTDTLTSSISSLKTLIAGYSIKTLIDEYIGQADSMKLLDARLKLTSASMIEYHSQQKELLQIAKETHSSLQDETNLYVKLNVPLKALHATTMQVNAVTESFTKGLKIGGAATTEASSATLQFAQAMASGVLRGDEFNSIAENSPKLMEYMAKGMGVPQTALRQMAENGELSAGRVANALLKMTNQIDSDFKQMPVTVDQSLTDLKTNISVAISEFDKVHGVTASIASGIDSFSKSIANIDSSGIDKIAQSVEVLAVTYGVMATASKSALLVEELYSKSKAISTASTASYTAVIEAETKAQQMGSYAQTIRAAADKAAVEAKISGLVIAEKHAQMLEKEATAAEASALAQTKNAYAMREAGIASGLMGTAMKAVPFLAVAGTVAILIASFFDAKSKSDDLNNSINATAESLSNLTKAQLENKRINLASESQDLSLQISKLKQQYGAKNGRTNEQQSEIDDLESSYKQLGGAMKLVADAQTNIRDHVTKTKQTLKDSPLPETLSASAIQKAEAAAKKAATDAENLKQAYLSINKDIAGFTGNEHDKAIANINDQAEKYRKSKVDEVKIGELTSAAMTALYQKENEERNKMLIDHYSTVGDDDAAYYIGLAQQIDDMVKKGTASYDEINTFREDSDRKYLEKKAKAEFDSDQASYDAQVKYIEEQRSALVDYYTTSGNLSDAFYITESDKIQKLAETGILSNEQLVAVWDKDFAHMQDSTIKLNTVFEDAFKSMEDSMVKMFMTGKFSAEDFFNTVIEGIIRMQIRNSITEPLTTAISGVNFGSMFSGMFGGTSSGINGSFDISGGGTSGIMAWEGGLIPYYSGGAVNNFTYGGYTGDGGKYEPKGVVHGGEYVIPKWQTQRIPAVITQLESMRTRGYADGGLVGSSLSGTSTPSMPVTIHIENKSGTPISAESVTPQFDGRSMVINVVIDAITRNAGGMRDAVRSVR